MQAGCATTHEEHQTLIREFFLETFVDDTTPFVAVNIVVLSCRLAIVVPHCEWVNFWLAKVAPPAFYAIFRECLVATPKPFASRRVADIKHAGIAYPCGHIVHLAFSVLHEHAFRCKHIIVVDSADFVDIWLRDDDHVDTLLLEFGKHLAVVRPLSRIPFESAHVGLYTIPVEVEHHTIDRIATTLERIDHSECFVLSAIAIL